MTARFGSFKPFCDAASLPVCKVLQAAPDCAVFAESGTLRDPATLTVDCCALVATSILIWHASTRKDAARKVEILLVLSTYLAVSVWDIFGSGRPLTIPSRVIGVLASFEVATITLLFVFLVFYALAGLLLAKSAKVLPIWASVVPASVIAIITLILGLVTFLHPSSTLIFRTADAYNPGLYIMHLGIPLLCCLAFAGIEISVVVKHFHLRPWLLGSAFFCFFLGQIFEFAASQRICQGTDANIDGVFFQTAFSLASIVLIYVQWTRIPKGMRPSYPEMKGKVDPKMPESADYDPDNPSELASKSVGTRTELDGAESQPTKVFQLDGNPVASELPVQRNIGPQAYELSGQDSTVAGLQHLQHHQQQQHHSQQQQRTIMINTQQVADPHSQQQQQPHQGDSNTQPYYGHAFVSELPASITWTEAQAPRQGVGTGADTYIAHIAGHDVAARDRVGQEQGSLHWG